MVFFALQFFGHMVWQFHMM